jgi:hypothetical protein
VVGHLLPALVLKLIATQTCRNTLGYGYLRRSKFPEMDRECLGNMQMNEDPKHMPWPRAFLCLLHKVLKLWGAHCTPQCASGQIVVGHRKDRVTHNSSHEGYWRIWTLALVESRLPLRGMADDGAAFKARLRIKRIPRSFTDVHDWLRHQVPRTVQERRD